MLLAALGAIFLKGFREAIGLAVAIVAVYLLLNVIVVGWGLIYLAGHPARSRELVGRGAFDYGSPAHDPRRAAVFPEAGARPLRASRPASR